MSPDSSATSAADVLARAPVAGDTFGARVWGSWRRLARRPPAVVGLVIVLTFVVVAIGAPWIAPADPNATSWSAIRKAPSCQDSSPPPVIRIRGLSSE